VGRVWKDIRTSVHNCGFAAYLAAGSAFFGSIPFTSVQYSNHVFFAWAWTFFFLVIPALQLAISRVKETAASGWTAARVIAVLFGATFAIWVWRGAEGLS
jgi:hypothetical protein